MKIKKLYIKEYKNLKDLKIEFTDSRCALIIGENGSGKSNLFEAISYIFKSIYREEIKKVNFDFEIEYEIKSSVVEIKYKEGIELKFYINKIESTYIGFYERKLFPNNIFAYHAGADKRLKEIYNSRKRIDQTGLVLLEQMKYIEDYQGKLALISLWSQTNEKNIYIEKFEKELKITEIKHIHIKLKNKIDSINENIKNIKNINENIVYQLQKIIKYGKIFDERTIYYSGETIKKLCIDFGGSKYMFASLDYLVENDNGIKDIEIYIKKSGNIIEYESLSEGEKQYVLLLSVLEIQNETDILYLLDEIDTYLHPKWQKQISDSIQELNLRGQVLITTHSPFTLGELSNSNILVMNNGAVKRPREEPKYLGANGLLLSQEYFALETLLSEDIYEKLLLKRKIASKKYLTPEDKMEIKELDSELSKIDMTLIINDPLYNEYVNARAAMLDKVSEEEKIDILKKILKNR